MGMLNDTSMKLEARSVPVYLKEGQTLGWTPYRIRQRPDNQVNVTAGLPNFTTQVKDFTQAEFILPIPWEEPVLVTKLTPHTFKVGKKGVLKINKTECTYTVRVSKHKKILFSASIPPGKRDVTCTGLAVVGASLWNSGFSH
jgi:hypothetical protein